MCVVWVDEIGGESSQFVDQSLKSRSTCRAKILGKLTAHVKQESSPSLEGGLGIAPGCFEQSFFSSINSMARAREMGKVRNAVMTAIKISDRMMFSQAEG